MPAYKNKENGSWYVSAYYKNWKGEQTRKLKRGFTTKRDALEWERNFLSQHSDDLDMSFENFVEIYKNDMKERLKLNTWTGKTSIIEQKIMPYFKEKKNGNGACFKTSWQTFDKNRKYGFILCIYYIIFGYKCSFGF